MSTHRKAISSKLEAFGTTIFAEMSHMALEYGAVNLSQGFPDFEGPPSIIDSAILALRSGHNQYARSAGAIPLVEAIAQHQSDFYKLNYDPLKEVIVFSGGTEAIASSLLGMLDSGDEVIVFEPFYDSYPACIALAGAVPRYCTLRFPDFSIDFAQLESLFNSKTRLLLLNTPHNPTGKVFSREELTKIAALCLKHEVRVISDEVYEHLTFDSIPHVPMATIDGMRDRTISIASNGKTFSFTGWKIGWASGAADMIAAAQSAHQFITFASAAPLQHAVASALRSADASYFSAFTKDYTERRDFLVETLRSIGLDVAVPRGTYFILADFRPIFDGDDRAFAIHLIEKCKVAAIPPSVFYKAHPEEGKKLVRFAFCKRMETLREAAGRLQRIAR